MITNARFVLSKSKTIEQYEKVKEIADIVSYSYKTNPEIANILRDNTDSMFSVHSIENLKQLKAGERTWFFAQAWNKKELGIIFMENVNKFVVDNEKDLEVLLDYIEENDREIWLLLRMRLKEHTLHTGKHFVYGMYSKQINRLLPELKKNKNVKKMGIHFHRKTQNVSEWDLKSELKQSIQYWDIDFVNIGGGMPARYKNFRQEVLDNIFSKVKNLKDWLSEKNVKVIAEPGRFIAASPVRLECNIKNIYRSTIIVDCSIYNAAMDTFIANIRLLVENELKEGESYTIKGCSPDSMDIFRYRVYLEDPRIGDKINFLNAGAYNFTSNYFNLPKLKTVVVD